MIVLGVALAALGVLWTLQGTGVFHIRPVLCVADCKPVNKSNGWVVAGLVALILGIAATAAGLRHEYRHRQG